jgi:hypothetical protein
MSSVRATAEVTSGEEHREDETSELDHSVTMQCPHPRPHRGPHPPHHPDLRTPRRARPRRPRLHRSRPVGDHAGQTTARRGTHPHPADGQQSSVGSPGTGRTKRCKAQVLADLPPRPLQSQPALVNRHRCPHPGAATLKGFSRRLRRLPGPGMAGAAGSRHDGRGMDGAAARAGGRPWRPAKELPCRGWSEPTC